jgi:anti-sigma factor RsiW
MDCNGLKDAAHAYFTGHLAEGERRAFDEHAATCAACGEFVRVCREITCREVNEFLHLYVEEELDAERRAVFDRHLAICPDCRNYLETYRASCRLLKRSHAPERDDAPTQLPERLLRAIYEAGGLHG